MHKILFVCLGNICRSPLAEGVFRALVADASLTERFMIDSAGTGSWHEGDPPDPRSIEIAAKHGTDISAQRARQISLQDFRTFDLILAMDQSNLETLRDQAPADGAALRLLLNTPPTDVPDPYYGGRDGFETVYQMVRKGGQALLRDIMAEPKSR